MIDWRHWHNEPYLVGGLVLLGWIWALLAGPGRARLAPGAVFPRGEAVRFYAALVVFYLAVGSPLDQIGERFLFSAHMLQHQLLIYPAAILFLRGLPAWMIDPVLGAPAGRLPARLLTHPLVCTLAFTLVISLWHAPSLYDWALRDKRVHVIEHAMFFGAALFYWWPILSPSRVRPRLGYGGQMLYLFAVFVAMTPIFAYIVFSEELLYPTYEYAPRLPQFGNVSAHDDQLIAGIAMKIVGMVVALATFGVAFQRWFAEGQNQSPAKT